MQEVEYFIRKGSGAAEARRIDLGFLDRGNLPSFPLLSILSVTMNAARSDGLSSSEEAPTLWDIEDLIEATLSNRSASLVGVVTVRGCRLFYIYSESGVGDLASIVSHRFPAYAVSLGNKIDPSHEGYLCDLFPNDDELDEIANRRVLNVLARNGDIHNLERQVDHDFEFPSAQAWSNFLDQADRPGMSVELWEPLEDTLVRGSVTFAHSVDEETINEVTREMRRLAAENGGTFTGWGCTAQDGKP